MANIDSIYAFINGTQKFGYNKNTVFVKDGILYSYGTHWPLAVRTPSGKIFVNMDNRGAAGANHRHDLTRELSRRGITHWLCPLEELQDLIKAQQDDKTT